MEEQTKLRGMDLIQAMAQAVFEARLNGRSQMTLREKMNIAAQACRDNGGFPVGEFCRMAARKADELWRNRPSKRKSPSHITIDGKPLCQCEGHTFGLMNEIKVTCSFSHKSEALDAWEKILRLRPNKDVRVVSGDCPL
jgi:hypothetical protein